MANRVMIALRRFTVFLVLKHTSEHTNLATKRFKDGAHFIFKKVHLCEQVVLAWAKLTHKNASKHNSKIPPYIFKCNSNEWKVVW